MAWEKQLGTSKLSMAFMWVQACCRLICQAQEHLRSCRCLSISNRHCLCCPRSYPQRGFILILCIINDGTAAFQQRCYTEVLSACLRWLFRWKLKDPITLFLKEQGLTLMWSLTLISRKTCNLQGWMSVIFESTTAAKLDGWTNAFPLDLFLPKVVQH